MPVLQSSTIDFTSAYCDECHRAISPKSFHQVNMSSFNVCTPNEEAQNMSWDSDKTKQKHALPQREKSKPFRMLRSLREVLRKFRIWNPPSQRSDTESSTDETSYGVVSALRRIDMCLSGKEFEIPAGDEGNPQPAGLFDRAQQNCQQTYIVLRTMRDLLTDLLRQQTASGCTMKATEESTNTEAWTFERVLQLNAYFQRIDDSPQSLYQILRICTWTCEEIKDELIGMQRDAYNVDQEYTQNRAAYIKRWEPLPEWALRDIRFCSEASKVAHASGIEELLDGAIRSNPVASSIEFWLVFEHWRPTQQMRTQMLQDEWSSVIPFGANLLSQMNKMQALNPTGQAQVRNRCHSNIECVKASLFSFLNEIAEELERRRLCTHGKSCRHHKVSTSGLRVARSKLERAISEVEKAGRTARTLFDRRVTAYEVKFVTEWGCLALNGFSTLIALKSEQLVERLLRGRQTIREAEVMEPVEECQVTPEDILSRAGLCARPRRRLSL